MEIKKLQVATIHGTLYERSNKKRPEMGKKTDTRNKCNSQNKIAQVAMGRTSSEEHRQ